MKIPYVDLSIKNKKDFISIFNKTLESGEFVGGSEIKKFENQISKICNTKYAVALNSGTDALTFALHCLGIKRGDEVITTPNSFIATVAAIVHLGAKPVFVDVLPDQNIDPSLIEKVITKKTKAIMPVHLTGRMSKMTEIKSIARKYNLKIIEDAAQSVLAKIDGKVAGSIGDVGCFSAHPLKNLNAMGDSGYLTTNNEKIYKMVKKLSNHGMENRNIVKNFGYVSRMDNLQAAILNYRLKNLDKVIYKRRFNAKIYYKNLNSDYIFMPPEQSNEYNTYHTFVIQIEKYREKLINYLTKKGIGSSIHYPVPIHLQPASKSLGYKSGDFKVVEKQAKNILTLPINENLNGKHIKYICKTVNSFFE
jgi:dTDP-4-amino-4,6-dideoxygalactose transaminase